MVVRFFFFFFFFFIYHNFRCKDSFNKYYFLNSCQVYNNNISDALHDVFH